MLVEINTHILKKQNISSDKYILLYFLFNQQEGGFESWYHQFNLKSVVKELMEDGYIVKGEIPEPMDMSKLLLNRQKVNPIFIGENDMFWEFYSTYPLKVNAARGVSSYRFLRAGTTNAKITQKAKKKYESIIKGSRPMHEHIMRCLSIELWLRKKDNSMSFMVEIMRYLNEMTWQKYESLLDMADKKVNTTKYGEKLI